MKACKISGISGYNIGDKVLSDCLSKLLDDKGISHDSYHLEPIHNPTLEIKKSFNNNYLIRNFDFLRNSLTIYIVLLFKTFKNLGYYLKISRKYDRVYYGGGNLISNADGSNYLFIALLLSFIVKKGGFVILFCGVGPFTYPYKLQLRFLAKNSKLFIVRDFSSIKYFQNNEKVKVIIDPAILCSYYYPLSILDENNKKNNVLFNVMDFSKIDKVLNKKNKLEFIVKNIYLISNYFKVSPILFITSKDDNSFNNEISNLYFETYKIQLPVSSPSSIYDLKELYSTAKLCLVHRMHAGIISASYKVPTLAFPWQEKVIGFSKLFYESSWETHILEKVFFDFEEVKEKYELIKNDNLEEKLVKSIKNIKEIEI
jgi:polysaccharide pyruvyl transferase WcaK-like protein